MREPAGTLNSMPTGGKSYYYLTDATGNVLGLVDDTGKRTHTYAYGPTGLPRGTTTEAVSQPYRYTGAYLDPTGLYKMGHRYYDPTLGRFTQPDPSGQENRACGVAGRRGRSGGRCAGRGCRVHGPRASRQGRRSREEAALITAQTVLDATRWRGGPARPPLTRHQPTTLPTMPLTRPDSETLLEY
ncbi:hypothetical protein GCM10010383_78380 [Streptomyces lomondensis]|uniref:Teneurin-like YD-shell domain-containing protein n=1 Tax=Streptomyces lomondensis TaxID=68229 RepID=A0ABQ2XWB8_9ACTN|nr:hypothetical protein GCM10010383_78380 [Streptomyces lomondensis]